MFNHSKTQKNPQNDASKFKDEHFTRATDTETKKTELLCGYLFDESDNKLYAVSGVCKNGDLDIRKSQIKVGGDGILHWTAFLAQTEEQRENPTSYADLWADLGVPGLGRTKRETRTGELASEAQTFNLSRATDGAGSDAADVSIKKYGRSAVSEVSTRFDGNDLVVETKATLFCGRTHVQTGGVTNYLVNALREIMKGAGERAIAMLEAKSEDGEGTEEKPVLP